MPTKKSSPTKTSAKKSGSTKRATSTKSTVKAASPKKTAPKAAAKKKTPAKTTKSSAKVLICAHNGECFWTTDGKVLADLTELRDALKEMADDVFMHHVTSEKNDFADWVEHVLGDCDCAQDLRTSQKPAAAHTVVVRHLRSYSL